MLALVKHDLGNGHTASLVHVLWGFGFVLFILCTCACHYLASLLQLLRVFPVRQLDLSRGF